jgi:hypothetical protein
VVPVDARAKATATAAPSGPSGLTGTPGRGSRGAGGAHGPRRAAACSPVARLRAVLPGVRSAGRWAILGALAGRGRAAAHPGSSRAAARAARRPGQASRPCGLGNGCWPGGRPRLAAPLRGCDSLTLLTLPFAAPRAVWQTGPSGDLNAPTRTGAGRARRPAVLGPVAQHRSISGGLAPAEGRRVGAARAMAWPLGEGTPWPASLKVRSGLLAASSVSGTSSSGPERPSSGSGPGWWPPRRGPCQEADS